MFKSLLLPNVLASCTLLASLVACDVGPSSNEVPVVSESRSEARAWNGRAWNGRAWNGRAWNGRAWNGRAWNGNSLGSTGIDGAGWRAEGADGSVQERAVLSLQGSTIKINGRSVAAMGGSVVLSPTSQPEVAMRIDGPTPMVDEAGVPRGIDAYSVYGDLNGGWEPMFVSDDGEPVLVVPLNGEWTTDDALIGTPLGGAWTDTGRITFAARGYALAKCVELGYKPYDAAGRDRHQSCVRMLRADYCGDGNTWTENGTMLNIYDGVGVQGRDTAKPYAADASYKWQFEAEWTPSGAVCVEGFRVRGPSGFVPACVRNKVLDILALNKCGKVKGSQFGAFNNARVMSEYATKNGAPNGSLLGLGILGL